MSACWVLLRGLTRESGHWDGLVPALRRQLGELRIVALDLPGNGTLHAEPSPTRIAAMTEACREQLHALGIAPPYQLLAMSLGAMVALDWADRAPQELAGGVLINTSLRRFNPWWQRLRPASWGALLALALWPLSDRQCEQRVLALTSRRRQADAALLDEWAALRAAHPVSRANALRQLLAAMRYAGPTRCPQVPLLLLASWQDGLVDPRCSARLAERWALALRWHPDAGHDLPLDDAPWVARQVRRWLATPGGTGTASARSLR